MVGVYPPSGHNFCQANLTQPDLYISPMMSLTALELNKLEVIRRATYVVAGTYVREIDPEKRLWLKKLRKLIVLSIIIKCDFYDPIDRPIRHNLGFDDVSLYFSKIS